MRAISVRSSSLASLRSRRCSILSGHTHSALTESSNQLHVIPMQHAHATTTLTAADVCTHRKCVYTKISRAEETSLHRLAHATPCPCALRNSRQIERFMCVHVHPKIARTGITLECMYYARMRVCCAAIAHPTLAAVSGARMRVRALNFRTL